MLFISFAFLSSAFLARSGKVDDESDFSYDENAENGPANWSNIHPNWIKCKTGKMQSPIDFPNNKVEIVSNLGILQKLYKPSNATLLNRGHDIMHTPSEHTINGKRYDMEAHLVHMSSDRKTAVIGILYEIGSLPDDLLTILEGDLIAVADKRGAEKGMGIIDPNIIKLDVSIYYRYIGSLTTPPCTEGLVWTIDGKVNSVTARQIKLLQDAAVN
ncbi:hypothetical protein EJD97_002447, partial [Solanum chilense]